MKSQYRVGWEKKNEQKGRKRSKRTKRTKKDQKEEKHERGPKGQKFKIWSWLWSSDKIEPYIVFLKNDGRRSDASNTKYMKDTKLFIPPLRKLKTFLVLSYKKNFEWLGMKSKSEVK